MIFIEHALENPTILNQMSTAPQTSNLKGLDACSNRWSKSEKNEQLAELSLSITTSV